MPGQPRRDWVVFFAGRDAPVEVTRVFGAETPERAMEEAVRCVAETGLHVVGIVRADIGLGGIVAALVDE